MRLRKQAKRDLRAAVRKLKVQVRRHQKKYDDALAQARAHLQNHRDDSQRIKTLEWALTLLN